MGLQESAGRDGSSSANGGVASEAGGLVLALPWYRLALGGILAIAALLNCWQLSRVGYGNTYYAAAVRSMLQSWHNFFFNSFDPGGFVSIDKPPLGFWFQVASAKLFGYNGVSLLLPEALAGVLAVAVLYHLVQRRFGRPAGLIAALVLAVTPVSVAASRNNIIDSILVLFLLLGAWAGQIATETGRLRWLLLAAALVGLGFNVKMLEAYLVVPAFGVLYLLGAPVAWRTRAIHLALTAVVLLAVSLSWALAVDATPASQRPWVDSTSTNSELYLAIGYNGLDRLLGRGRSGGGGGQLGLPVVGNTHTPAQPGAAGAGSAALNTARAGTGAPRAGNAGGLFNNGAAGPFRLFGSVLGGQIGWLVPLAFIGLIVAASRRLRFPLDDQQRGLVLWGTWLLTTAGFFSVANFFHPYYMVTMAPAMAALCGIGLVAAWGEYARRSPRLTWQPWALPVALVGTAATQAYILRDYPDWSRPITPVLLILAVLAATVLIVARLGLRLGGQLALRLWTPLVATVGVVALLIAPVAWSIDTAAAGDGGLTPTAGPSAPRDAGGFGGFGGFARLPGANNQQTAALIQRFQRGGGFRGGRDGQGVSASLLRYLEQHQSGTKFLFAATNSNSAAPYIIQTGKAVMSMGGFSGSNPILSLTQLQALVKDNTVRYFLAGGGFGGRGGGDSNMQWVQSACTLVPSSAYGGTSAQPAAAGSGSASPSGGMLGSTQTPPSGSLPGGAQRGSTPSSNPAPGYAPGGRSRHTRIRGGSFGRGSRGEVLPGGGATGGGQPTDAAPAITSGVSSSTTGTDAGTGLGSLPGGFGGGQGLYDCAGASS